MTAKIFYIYFVKPTCILPRTKILDFGVDPLRLLIFVCFGKWLPNGAKADI